MRLRARVLYLLALALVCAGFVASTVRIVAVAAPFEYDEAVYAAKGRAWVTSTPDAAWSPYRAPALPALASLLWRAGARAEWPYRATGVAAGVLVLLAIAALGRSIGRRALGEPAALAVGAVAAAAFAAAPELQRRSAQFLTDVPATAALLALAIVLWRQLVERERPTGGLLLVGPLAGLAYALRYGSAPAIALLLVVALALGWRRLRARPRLTVAAGVVTVLVFLPHLVFAVRTFGAPWGGFTFTLELAHADIPHRGLGGYLAGIPRWLAGPVGGALMLAGIASAVRAALIRVQRARARVRDPRMQASAFLVVPALATIVALGIAAHAQARYVFFPVALLLVAGAIALVGVTGRGSPRVRVAAVVLGVLAVGVSGAVAAEGERGRAEARRRTGAGIVAAAGAIARAGEDAGCAAPAAVVPQIGWYAACPTSSLEDPGHARFLVLVEGMQGRVEAARAAQPPVFEGDGVVVLRAATAGGQSGP